MLRRDLPSCSLISLRLRARIRPEVSEPRDVTDVFPVLTPRRLAAAAPAALDDTRVSVPSVDTDTDLLSVFRELVTELLRYDAFDKRLDISRGLLSPVLFGTPPPPAPPPPPLVSPPLAAAASFWLSRCSRGA